MTPNNPIEDAFIKAVEDIVVSIFRQESSLQDYLTKLENHVEQAQKKGWLRYQATTLNAIGLAYIIYGSDDPKHILTILHEALDIAEKTDYLAIKLKIINNIAYQLLSSFFDFESAEKQIDHGWTLFEESGQLPSVTTILLATNKIGFYLKRGDFAAAQQFLDRAFDLADNVVVTETYRNDYYRYINALRESRIRANIAQKQCENLLTDIKLNKEMYEQLYKTDVNMAYYANMALYRLICEQDVTGYETWINKVDDTIESMEIVEYLKELHYYPQALDLIHRILKPITPGGNIPLDGFIQDILQQIKDGMQQSTELSVSHLSDMIARDD